MRNRFNANCFNNGANSISFPEAQQFSRALFFRDEKSFLVRVTSRVGGQKFQSETMLLGPVVLLFICCALVPIGRIYIYIIYINITQSLKVLAKSKADRITLSSWIPQVAGILPVCKQSFSRENTKTQ